MKSIKTYKFHSYSLSQVKLLETEDMYCFSVKLINPEGKVVATISNSGRGGDNDNDFVSKEEEKAFYDHIKPLTYFCPYTETRESINDEIYVNELIDEHLMLKHAKRGYFTVLKDGAERGEYGHLKSGGKKVRWSHKGLPKYIATKLKGYSVVGAPEEVIEMANEELKKINFMKKVARQ
tara:strand:- start:70 stop:606 length:537 start_codon:yes stop_codon:yes gene_type:complete